LLEADVIVFRIKEDIEEAKFAIKILESSQYNNTKAFILVSSVISWAKIKRNYIEEEEEEPADDDADEDKDDKADDDDDGDEDDSDEDKADADSGDDKKDVEEKQSEEPNVPPPPPKRKDFEPLQESDFVTRKPHDNYKRYLEVLY
jgi:cobalamin biosynthesis protein CobT